MGSTFVASIKLGFDMSLKLFSLKTTFLCIGGSFVFLYIGAANFQPFFHMVKYIRGILTGFLSLLCFVAVAQIPYLRQYTVSDGLLTNEVYQVYQDSRGYIWLATSCGVSKFDGRHFIHIDNPKGFRNTSILEIKEDARRQLWFVALNGKIFSYRSSTVVPFVYNSQVLDQLNTNKGHIKKSFIPLSDSSLIISYKERGSFTVPKNGVVSYRYPNQQSEVVFDFTRREPFISFQYLRTSGTITVEVRDVRPQDTRLIRNLKIAPTHLYAAKLRNGSKVFSIDRNLFVVSKGVVKRFEMTDAVTDIFEDKESHVWIAINGHGAYCYANEDFSRPPLLKILEKEVITSILQDREGSYWFSTLNSGVFFTPSLAFTNFSKGDGLLSNNVSRVMACNGNVWVGYSDGFVSCIGPNGAVRHFSCGKAAQASVKGLACSASDGSVWVSYDKLYRIKNGRVESFEHQLALRKKNPNYALLPRNIKMARDGGFWVTSSRGFKKIKDGRVVYDSFESGDFTGMVFSVAEEPNGNLWITSNALFLYSRGKVRQVGASNALLSSSIIKGEVNSYDNRLWLATKNNGVLVLNGRKLVQISSENGLQSSNVSGLAFRDNQVWVASNRGVDRITLHSINPIRYTIKHYNTSHGLISNEVKDIFIDGRYVYFATVLGLSRFDLTKRANNKVPPPVVISSVKVNDAEADTTKLSKLRYDQNFIDISFNGLTFKSDGDTRFRYKVDGMSDRWFYTTEGNIRLYKLPPGEYKVTVAAENNDHVWSNAPATLKFSIKSPFWGTLWFWGLCLLLILLIAYAVFLTRLRIVQKISMHKQKENLWKNQSLSLQMNPHFIFNTLNSIQLFILKCDVDSSLHYLSRFSSLMRKTLENSNKMNITLKEELESLELYLELESLRCEGKFSYVMDIDPEISVTDVYVPTLLIQPYVENAIWHGIMPKTGPGNIRIRVQSSGAFIKCCIIDDGIGRIKSLEIQKLSTARKHRSFATKITANRIDILKTLYNKDFSFEYEDRYDGEGNSLGTEVVLIFPRDYMSSKQVNTNFE